MRAPSTLPRGGLWAAALGALLAAQPARAQDAPRSAATLRPLVHIELDPCVPAPAPEVRRIAAIELGATLVVADALSPETTRVDAGCVASGVELRVSDPLTGKSLARTVALSRADPAARARLLALAIAELVAASWFELAARSDPGATAAPSVAPSASAQARQAAARAVRRRVSLRSPSPVRALVAFAARVLPAGLGATLGASARVAGRVGRSPFGWSADAVYEHAGVQSALGLVSVDAGSAGALATWGYAGPVFGLYTGLGLRAGVAHFAGQPDAVNEVEGRSFTAPWGGPMVAVGASLTVARVVVVESLVEAGYVALPVGGLVGGERAVALDGPWLGLQLGVGLDP